MVKLSALCLPVPTWLFTSQFPSKVSLATWTLFAMNQLDMLGVLAECQLFPLSAARCIQKVAVSYQFNTSGHGQTGSMPMEIGLYYISAGTCGLKAPEGLGENEPTCMSDTWTLSVTR
ncbi:hypothetical protein DFH06DRAFT_1164279 [Mycena polygramma]|nr:hypothetical protein DFH06DRAFT_1164279 [Mycena polygramma]